MQVSPSGIFASATNDLQGRPGFPFHPGVAEKEELFTEAVDYSGQAVVAVTGYIDQTDWGLVVQMRKSEAYSPVVRLRTCPLLRIGVSSLALIAAALFIARSITRQSRPDRH